MASREISSHLSMLPEVEQARLVAFLSECTRLLATWNDRTYGAFTIYQVTPAASPSCRGLTRNSG